VLRKAVEAHLPGEIFNRKDKIGFETPIEKYIKREKIYLDYNYNTDEVLEGFKGADKLKYCDEDQKKFKYYTLSRFLQKYFQ